MHGGVQADRAEFMLSGVQAYKTEFNTEFKAEFTVFPEFKAECKRSAKVQPARRLTNQERPMRSSPARCNGAAMKEKWPFRKRSFR